MTVLNILGYYFRITDSVDLCRRLRIQESNCLNMTWA